MTSHCFVLLTMMLWVTFSDGFWGQYLPEGKLNERSPTDKLRVKRQSSSGAVDEPASCEDLHKNCRRWSSRDYCEHDDYKRFMKIKCRKSCELCDGGRKPEPSTCEDKRSNCAFWAEQGHCEAQIYKGFMDINCHKSCDKCSESGLANDPIMKTTSTVASTTVPMTSTRQPVTSTTPPMTTTLLVTSTTSSVTSTTSPVTSTTLPMTSMTSSVKSTTPSLTSATPPVTSTTPPLTSTTPPVTSTTPPLTSTTPPVTSTTPPLTSTTPPVTSTTPPVTSTTPPLTSTTPPVTSTTPPLMSTRQPVTSTTPPMTTTLLVTSTTLPATTTTSPVTSTTLPMTSKTPSVTSKTPTLTSTAPSVTSTTPYVTPTTPPVTSTTPPMTSANLPTTSTMLFMTSTRSPVTTISSTTFLVTSTSSLLQTHKATIPNSSLTSSTTSMSSSTSPQTMPSFTSSLSPSSTPSAPLCEDLSSSCSFLAYFCRQSLFAQINCKASCGLCPRDAYNSTLSIEMTSLESFDDVTSMEPIVGNNDVTIGSGKTSNPVQVTSPSVSLSSNNNMTSHNTGKPTADVTLMSSFFTITTNLNEPVTTPPTSPSLPIDNATMATIPFRTTTHTTPIPNDIACEDGFEECVNIYMFCDVNKNVRDNCKKTCGLCVDVTVALTTIATETTTKDVDEVCEDTFSKCVELISECRRPESTSFLKQTCRKTCGFCADPVPSNQSREISDDSSDCQDTQDVCQIWAQSGFCDSAIYPELKRFMQSNCRSSCKLCGGTTWSPWTSCSLSCGGGKQTRAKITCENGTCSEPIVENRFCSLEVCPNKPDVCEDRISAKSCQQYKERNACGTEVISALCSATCGICVKKNATTSQGQELEWQPWGSWSYCNASCNGGVQTRNRTCSNASCDGPSKESAVCNSFRCHNCYDQSSNCKTMEDLGACRKVVWKVFCKVTCGICRPLPIQGRCFDSNTKCPSLRGSCSTISVAHACPVTCGRCAAPTEPPVTTMTPITRPFIEGLPKLCTDQHAGCAEAVVQGYCSDQRIVDVCPGSCGKCRQKLKKDSNGTKCMDKWDFCPTLEAGCKNSSFVQDNCRFTCNRCIVADRKDGCSDQSPVCPALARYGQCASPTVSAGCRLSCDPLCSPTISPVITTTVLPSGTTASCVDGNERCPEYHALGRCDNAFIGFLCPLSCRACGGERLQVVPQCKDSLGPFCSMYASKCSSAVVRYGCEKTCAVCRVITNKCVDTLEKECQALGKEGMCSMAGFRQQCPVTCDSCTVDDVSESTSKDEEKVLSLCVDQNSNCANLASLCTIDSAIKSMCRKTCKACSEVETSSGDTRCIDINPERCSSLSALDQCKSNPSIAFMCAKSCGKCVNADCVDKYAECDNVKQYCTLRAIQLQCAQTCSACGVGDEEGADTAFQTAVSSKSSEICTNYIYTCDEYKRYCGMEGWMDYMDAMCPKTCGACGQGTWTKWSSWSQCSKSCNDDPGPLDADSGGNRTRNRQCIDGAYCVGGKESSVEVGKCNKDRCPQQAEGDSCVDESSCKKWKSDGRCRIRRYRGQMRAACPVACGYCNPEPTWSSWSDCDATCGQGQQTRTMQCNHSKCKQTKQINSIETQNCTLKSCDGWTTWSAWSRCSATCGVGSKLRIRTCTDGDPGESMCPGSYLIEDVCTDNLPCAVWASWSLWSRCSLTCGFGKKLRNRTCLNSNDRTTCEGTGIESDSCNEWSCFEWTEWGPWGNCSIPCGGQGNQTRFRKCPGVEGSCGKKSGARQKQSCGTEECATWTPWSNWTRCSVPCGEGGTQRRSRACLGSELCIGHRFEKIQCVSKNPCSRWSDWSEFSSCSATCGKGYATRTRVCNTTRFDSKEEGNECPGESSEKVVCNCNVCPDVGVWSPWGEYSDCPVTCNGGTQTRRRLCLNGIPGRGGCQGPSHDTMRCGEDTCLMGKWDLWGEWSRCSASCGDGLRARDRTCLGGKENEGGCSGNEENMERCNTHVCPMWSDWESWGGCSSTCGSSGTRTRTKSCYDEHIGEIVFEDNCAGNNVTFEKESCNVHDCPTWAAWESWTDCSASCGVGFSLRQRGCQNGIVGDRGCHISDTSEKLLCNEWDCPAACRTVPLKMDWRSSDSDNIMIVPSNDMSWLNAQSRSYNQTITCLTMNDTNRWVQMSFRRSRTVAGISMKGYQNVGARKYSWVKKFLVLYGDDLDTLEPILDNANRPRLFIGPSGPIATEYRYWEPVKAKHWRMQILASQPTRWVCMETSLYRCRNKSDNNRSVLSEGDYDEGSGRI